METAHIAIVIGILVVLFSLYQYSQPPAPPKVTVSFHTTTTSSTSTTEFVFKGTSTTSRRINTDVTLRTTSKASTLASTPSTTLIPASCLNNVVDVGEDYADCSVQCGNCVILNLTQGVEYWVRYLNENLWLKFENASRVQVGSCVMPERKDRLAGTIGLGSRCFENVYSLTVKTTEITPDERKLYLGEQAHPDQFEIEIIGDYNTSIEVIAKRNYDTLSLTPEYVILSLGGYACNINQTGFCKRNWMNYAFELRERASDKAKIDLTLPSGRKLQNLWLTKSNMTIMEGISMGLLYPLEKGGYSTIYVKKL